jgi:DNA-binding transcriptional MerR regulator
MQKLYYSISEVSKMVGEPQYILRYWEKEFPILNPKKNRAGNRIYSDKDIEIVMAIKTMLREQKLSTKGVLEELYRMFEKPSKTPKKPLEPKKKKVDTTHQKEQTLFSYNTNYKIILGEIRNSLETILNIAKNL